MPERWHPVLNVSHKELLLQPSILLWDLRVVKNRRVALTLEKSKVEMEMARITRTENFGRHDDSTATAVILSLRITSSNGTPVS